MYTSFFKPAADFLAALLAIIILSPVWILVFLLLAIANKGKPLFVQSRPGKNERVFKLIKFKTMTDERDPKGNFLPDEDRLTSIGRLVRKTSMDELPQLFNVLKGDMSLVGPRPLLVAYLQRYNSEQRRRHEVMPGITGWAQVNGRNAISWEQKFEFDVWYVNHQSFWLDLKILLMTVVKVFKREGINQRGQATMQPFLGSKKEN